MIERLRLTQPNLDTKPGTVARDLFIDIQADQIERLHKALSLISEKQSFGTASGRDLDRLARNFGISRNSGTPSTGVVVFTTNDVISDVPIPSGTIVTARNGLAYKTIGNYVISSVEKNLYAANATRLRSALNTAGINDSFSLEVPVEATRAGQSGNVSSLQIVSHSLGSSLKVINLSSLSGGVNSESDLSFRARILAVFSGSNTGTAAGYRNAALAVNGVLDVLVAEPGSTLMLRDGTETIEINDGSFRILSSGTGGKVDMYVLGTRLKENIESFIYTDLSGSGTAEDDRNDVVLGLSGIQDSSIYKNLTSEERRVSTFKSGNIPAQPVNSVVSVVGTESGIFSSKVTNSDGSTSGNYELLKDDNPETGGSPFCFDKLHWILSKKNVIADSLTKGSFNSADSLGFSDIQGVDEVYQDLVISGENSKINISDRGVVNLNHGPVVTVSRVTNRTTGEIYVVESQNIDSTSGLNEDAQVVISGKNLPTSADILSVDYLWRRYFDKYIEYNGAESNSIYKDPYVTDSIDWGVSSGISGEEALLARTADDLEYQISAQHPISRISSLYSKVVEELDTEVVEVEESTFVAIILNSEMNEVKNIVSIRTESGLEAYNTNKSDGTFSSRTIYLPTDSPVASGEKVYVHYNKNELFFIEQSDASFSENLVTLPSEDILSENGLLDLVEEISDLDDNLHIDYIADISNVFPETDFSGFPIRGNNTTNSLLSSGLSQIDNSYQPLLYNFNVSGAVSGIMRFCPSKIKLTTTGVVKSGKVKVLGTTFTRAVFDVDTAISVTGSSSGYSGDLTFDIGSEIKEFFGLGELPSNISIARVDSVAKLDVFGSEEGHLDILGYTISKNNFDTRSSLSDPLLDAGSFVIKDTTKNSGIDITGGTKLRVSVLISNENDFEEIFFRRNESIFTEKMFSRIDRVSIPSGFRNSSGVLIGSISALISNQPLSGSAYNASYNFSAPKEGERITVRYNNNIILPNVTASLEQVRSITADVLAKEASEILIDVDGQILINEDSINNSATIVENVSSQITNLLNTSRLGSTVDYSDIVSAATSVNGVDSINISKFNVSGESGKKSFIKSLDNQTISAGTILFESVTRENFRLT